MKREMTRQLVHLSGVIFVLLSLFVDAWLVAAYSFMIAFGLVAYAFYMRMEKSRLLKMVERLEAPFRKALMYVECRRGSPFAGAIWFFFSMGIAFIAFPAPFGQAAVWMLAAGDSVSTMVGKSIGKHKILGKKTAEGTLSVLALSLTAVWLAPLLPVIAGAVAAALAELLPEARQLKGLHAKGIVDDNWMIPIVAGSVMWLVSVI